MSAPIKPQDVDQFFQVVNIPEGSITPDTLAGVRQLDERRELEPMLRQILFDPGETPHGPTEIADVLTRVDVRGRRCEAAFVLKGKSYAKVRSTAIAHQLLRLRQLPALGLIVLVAVGDIQDDARRDFEQVAVDTGCDFLVMDAIDCARLLVAYGKICPADGTPLGDDGVCRLGHEHRRGLELRMEVGGDPEYEIAALEDNSHAGARRLSARILVSRFYGRDVLREVIRRATRDVAHDTYHRNELVASHWGGSPAHVVWLFLAADMLDLRTFNWLARSEWIDPALDERRRPMRLRANEYVDEIGVVWEEQYSERRQCYRKNAGSKGEFLGQLNPLVERARVTGGSLCHSFSLMADGAIDEQELIRRVRYATPEIDDISQKSAALPLPPQDANDYDRRAQSAFCWLSNMSLYYSVQGVETWSQSARTSLMKRTVEDFLSDLGRLEFEREKLR